MNTINCTYFKIIRILYHRSYHETQWIDKIIAINKWGRGGGFTHGLRICNNIEIYFDNPWYEKIKDLFKTSLEIVTDSKKNHWIRRDEQTWYYCPLRAAGELNAVIVEISIKCIYRREFRKVVGIVDGNADDCGVYGGGGSPKPIRIFENRVVSRIVWERLVYQTRSLFSPGPTVSP